MINKAIPQVQISFYCTKKYLDCFFIIKKIYIPLVYYFLYMAKVFIRGYRCERCRHEWMPRNWDTTPKVCPKCKSPYWDRPRKKS